MEGLSNNKGGKERNYNVAQPIQALAARTVWPQCAASALRRMRLLR